MLDETLRDLEQHADDFSRRAGFTYTVLENEDRVIGCVYIYRHDQTPRSRTCVQGHASRAELDPVLQKAVTDWLATGWPFSRVSYRNNA